MYSNDILITETTENQSVSLELFLKSPEILLNCESEYLWFTTNATHSTLDSAPDLLTSSDDVVQFCSSDLVASSLTDAPAWIKAAIGFTGVTAIKTELLRRAISNSTPDTEIELLLAIAGQNVAWRVIEQPDTSFPLRSPIPAPSVSHSNSLLSTLRSLPIDGYVSESPESTTTTEILAGLLLIHDFLDPSHEYSQSIEGMGADGNGDYWHGIMHRREPDFGNAKYWFRRVGNHPCFPKLAETTHQLAKRYQEQELQQVVQNMTSSGWDSVAAVDFFQEAHTPARRGSDWHSFAEELQLAEMLNLLIHCCQQPH